MSHSVDYAHLMSAAIACVNMFVPLVPLAILVLILILVLVLVLVLSLVIVIVVVVVLIWLKPHHVVVPAVEQWSTELHKAIGDLQ